MRPLQPCMRLRCPRRAWLLGLVLLVGLSACGPAPSDHAPSLEPRASLGGPSESLPVLQHSPSIPHDPVTPAARPAPLASSPASAGQGEARPAEPLVVPAWMAKDLDSPDVHVRLRALDRWAQQGSTVPLDPLLVALDDDDDDVRARARALLAEDWVWGQAAEPQAKP